MKKGIYILIACWALAQSPLPCFSQEREAAFEFYGDTIRFPLNMAGSLPLEQSFTATDIIGFIKNMEAAGYESLVRSLLQYKQERQADDWLYYQLIRKAAQFFSPKGENYIRYTLYKWYLLTRSGYDALLTMSGNKLLFYVRSEDNIYNIPYRMKEGKKYVCLNFHDYTNLDLDREHFSEVSLPAAGAYGAFSYKVTKLPDFNSGDYLEKNIAFSYNEQEYHFRIRLNPQVGNIFRNYPVADYEAHFNMPLSNDTYRSLIPSLKKYIRDMKPKQGVDFLMHFTRYAFLFKPDIENFGQEKRLSPEQTLLYDYSDCEDRAALFFFLVKELYNLPMIVLTYPRHVSIAVQFEKPYGKTIDYKGNKYSVCEPSPQRVDLRIGQMLPELKDVSYEVAYAYAPAGHK
ncbi:MAG TPA: hypothetical protein VFR58_06365 [Flavisolibacter sp.]|nr:hypothetical protein [Flavisolibacter sp.]